MNKKSNDPSSDKKQVTKDELDIIDGEFKLKKEEINDFLTIYERKHILSKQFHQNSVITDDEESLLSDDSDSEEESSSGEEDDSSENENEDAEKNEIDGEDDESSSSDVSGDLSNDEDEDSYGGKYRNYNFAHLGEGYDEEDSFIDNSEAVDEVLPKNMRPKQGGFYINKSAKVKLVETKEPEVVAKAPLKRKKKTKIKNMIKSDDDGSGGPSDDNQEIEAKKKKLSIPVDANDNKPLVDKKMQIDDAEDDNSNSKEGDNQVIHLKTVNNQIQTTNGKLTESQNSEINFKIESFTKITNELRENLRKFEETLSLKKSTSESWDNDMKILMLKIHKLQQAVQDKNERANLITYMANKIGISRGALRRRFNRIVEHGKNEHQSQSMFQQLPKPIIHTSPTIQKVTPKPIIQASPVISTMTTTTTPMAQKTQTQIKQSPKAPSQIINFKDFSIDVNIQTIFDRLSSTLKDDIYSLINLTKTKKINIEIKTKDDQEFFTKLNKVDGLIKKEISIIDERTKIYSFLNQIINVQNNNSPVNIQKLIKLSHIFVINRRLNENLVKFNNKLREIISNGLNFEFTNELKSEFKTIIQLKLRSKSLDTTIQLAEQPYIKDFIQYQIVNPLPKTANTQLLLQQLTNEANQYIQSNSNNKTTKSQQQHPQVSKQQQTPVIPHSLNSILSTSNTSSPSQTQKQKTQITQSPSNQAQIQSANLLANIPNNDFLNPANYTFLTSFYQNYLEQAVSNKPPISMSSNLLLPNLSSTSTNANKAKSTKNQQQSKHH